MAQFACPPSCQQPSPLQSFRGMLESTPNSQPLWWPSENDGGQILYLPTEIQYGKKMPFDIPSFPGESSKSRLSELERCTEELDDYIDPNKFSFELPPDDALLTDWLSVQPPLEDQENEPSSLLSPLSDIKQETDFDVPEREEDSDQESPQSDSFRISLSDLKKDQVVNRNLASLAKSIKPYVKVSGGSQVKSIRIMVIFSGIFQSLDYSKKPLELPDKFLQPNVFEAEKGQSDIFYINKAKFLKDGNIGQLYNYMEQLHKCKTNRLKDHPIKKNLGLRVYVQFEDGEEDFQDFLDLFTLDGHRETWTPSKQKSPSVPSSPQFEDIVQRSRFSNSKRVKESINFPVNFAYDLDSADEDPNYSPRRKKSRS